MRHDEDTLQMLCVRWFGWQYPEYAPLLHHSPNGGKRNAREAGRFKAMGTKAGFPDLFLPVARGNYHGLMVELKTATGRQSPLQRAWQEAVEAQGYRYAIARSVEQFEETVNDYLK